MATPTETRRDLTLARDGGAPARTRPEAPMFPGGMEVGAEEIDALRRVIESKNLFRYYGVGAGPDEVASFERELAEAMGAKHAICVNAGSSAHLRSDRRRRRRGGRGHRSGVHMECDAERRARDPGATRTRRG